MGRPPGGRLRQRERESSGPEPGASPFRALGCGRHTPRTADESHARPRPPGSAKPPAGVCGRGARGRRGWGAGATRETLQGGSGRGSASSPFSLLLLAPFLPTPNGASSYVLWSRVKFRDSGWRRALSLRCPKCFLCLRRRVPGSLACGPRLWGGGGRDGPRRSVTPYLLPRAVPRLAATGHSCSGPGACGLGESGPGDPRGQARPPRESASSEQCWFCRGAGCVFLRRLRVQSWHFSSSP